MKITIEMLVSKNACAEGMAWVRENLPEGAEYQEFLDRLATADKPDWASWLLENFGVVTETKEISEILPGTKHIFAAGRLVLKINVCVDGAIQAGEGIKAARGIEAGEGIKAARGIEAGEGIEAGLAVTCKLAITVRLRIFAGICGWRLPREEETKITCAEVKSGTVAHGKLVIRS